MGAGGCLAFHFNGKTKCPKAFVFGLNVKRQIVYLLAICGGSKKSRFFTQWGMVIDGH